MSSLHEMSLVISPTWTQEVLRHHPSSVQSVNASKKLDEPNRKLSRRYVQKRGRVPWAKRRPKWIETQRTCLLWTDRCTLKCLPSVIGLTEDAQIDT